MIVLKTGQAKRSQFYNQNFECNTESGSKESLSIALGVKHTTFTKKMFLNLVLCHVCRCGQPLLISCHFSLSSLPFWNDGRLFLYYDNYFHNLYLISTSKFFEITFVTVFLNQTLEVMNNDSLHNSWKFSFSNFVNRLHRNK